MTSFQGTKKIMSYSFQSDLDKIAREYTKSIYNVRSFIEVKKLERARVKDLAEIKQIEENLHSLKAK